MCGVCNVWVCVCVGLYYVSVGRCGFVTCGCVYVWVLECVGVYVGGSPLVRGSGDSYNSVREISFHIVKPS